MMKPDQDRVRHLLTDTVTLLCKNGLQYQKELRVQGLLGITLDDTDVFVVHINEKFDLIGATVSKLADDSSPGETVPHGDDTAAALGSTSPRQRRKKRRRSSASKSPSPPPQTHDDCTTSPQECTALDVAEADDVKPEKEIKIESDVIILDDQNPMGSADIDYVDMSVSRVSYGDPFTSSVTPDIVADPSAGGEDHTLHWQSNAIQDTGGISDDAGYTNSIMQQLPTWSRTQTVPAPQIPQQAHSSMPYSSHEQTLWSDVSPRLAQLQQQCDVLYACSYSGCGKQFRFSSCLSRHEMKKHGKPRVRVFKNRRSWTRTDKQFVCQFPGCGKKYFAAKILRQHQQLKHRSENFGDHLL